MIFVNQPKKIKGARKKIRQEIIERLQLQYPMWFENKTEREIINLVNAFRATGMDDEHFQSFCISYESKLEQKLIEGA